MANVKLIIEMPEEMYKWVCDVNKFSNDYGTGDFVDLIKNGTPLPNECDAQRIVPKTVNVQKWIYTKCPNPNCDYELSKHHGDGYYSIEHKPNFCPVCGQALLWESEE